LSRAILKVWSSYGMRDVSIINSSGVLLAVVVLEWLPRSSFVRCVGSLFYGPKVRTIFWSQKRDCKSEA
jgi:hypothetical protein